jgi:glycosyltransferase involved in cell wall biosynthesis
MENKVMDNIYTVFNIARGTRLTKRDQVAGDVPFITAGSTRDGFKQKITNTGIEFKYINLIENKGQAYAVNIGLQEVTGEYFCWQDVDDIYYPNCLSKCYDVIKKNPEYKLILNKTEVVNSSDLNKIIGYLPNKKFNNNNLFLKYLKDKGFYGAIRFVETKALFETLKNNSIDTSRGGQNLQLLLPLTYKYKAYFLEEILSKYVIYNTSHSHSVNKKKHRKQILNIKMKTLDRIKMPLLSRATYKVLVYTKYILNSFEFEIRTIIKQIKNKI